VLSFDYKETFGMMARMIFIKSFFHGYFRDTLLEVGWEKVACWLGLSSSSLAFTYLLIGRQWRSRM